MLVYIFDTLVWQFKKLICLIYSQGTFYMDTLAHIHKPYYRQPIPCYGFETIYAETNSEKLLDLIDKECLYKDLAHSGAVIYKGFSDSLNEFNEFIKINSSKVTFDPARKASTSNTAEIDAGIYEMGLHKENGNLPFSPDIQWFYCLEPANKGSQTTLCDGEQVLFELPREIRQMFEQRNIRYSRRIPWGNVKKFLSIELSLPIEEINDSHLLLVNDLVEGQTYSRIDKNLILSEYVTSAISNSCFSNKKSFCNSMLSPSVNYEPPKITWEDGENIEFSVWDSIKDITSKNTYKHFWQKGDIIVIDNTRVMHGRCRLEDINRRIFGAQSYRKGSENE